MTEASPGKEGGAHRLSITHISDVVFALSESFVILFVTPIRGGVTDERGEGSRYIWLA
jgi:hypothetical protein